MIMFVVCCNCKETIEERAILDLAGLFPWHCPKCGAVNGQIQESETEEMIFDVVENLEIVIEERDASPDDLKNNILEGLV